MNLRHRLRRLETCHPPDAHAFREALRLLRETGNAPEGPAGDLAREIEADIAAMDDFWIPNDAVPAPPA